VGRTEKVNAFAEVGFKAEEDVSKHRTVKTGFDPAKRNEGGEVMATPTRIQGENPIFLHGDGEKIVFKLDFFPELIQALRDGDLLTGRLFCAQLFGFGAGRSSCVSELANGLEHLGEGLAGK